LRILLVYCHPVPTSFNAALFATVREVLTKAGHDLRVTDLYAEKFDPVMSRAEREIYLTDAATLARNLAPHVEALEWAEALIFIFPTWYYGPPAMLKGWLERVWLPDRAFEVPKAKGDRARGKLTNIRRLVVVTTSGSPWWWLKVIRDPVKSLFKRGLRVLFHPHCRTIWLQLYSINSSTHSDRQAFLAKVEARLAALPLKV
jgi:putative NADPH-quinone reductase